MNGQPRRTVGETSMPGWENYVIPRAVGHVEKARRAQARRAVKRNARSHSEAMMFSDMLGLTPEAAR